MKTVIDTNEVAHFWIHARQDHAKNSGHNFYYNGDTIYSYGSHFPIAVIDDKNGPRTVLFTTRTYSNTTAKHIGLVRDACSHINKIYCHNPKDAKRGAHDENIAAFETEAKKHCCQTSKSYQAGKIP